MQKIALDITAVEFDQFSLYSTGTMIIYDTQPIATLLHELKDQTLASFNLG